jgi:hypothetical protein
MPIKLKLSSLRQTRWYEYAVRFLLGGLTTILAGVIAKFYGPVVGGLFLAFPAIFPASATLVEKHERERKEKAGLSGSRRGKDAAALEAAGAALGSVALAAFGAVIWLVMPANALAAFFAAAAAWTAVAAGAWWLRRFVRSTR